MAYLHGDIADNEAEAACLYEYAREAAVLREAARMHKKVLSLGELVEKISQRFLCEASFAQSPWLEIFTCGHFPRLSWVELS